MSFCENDCDPPVTSRPDMNRDTVALVFDNISIRRTRNPGPTTPVKRGRGQNLRNRVSDSGVSVESPYFSPSKELPRPKGKTFLIVEHAIKPIHCQDRSHCECQY